MSQDEYGEAREWYGDTPNEKLRELIGQGNELAKVELERRERPRPTPQKQSPDIPVTRLARGNDCVSIVDIKMPFWSMVVFMVKWSIASIPALIILWLIIAIILGVAGVGLGGLFSLLD